MRVLDKAQSDNEIGNLNEDEEQNVNKDDTI